MPVPVTLPADEGDELGFRPLRRSDAVAVTALIGRCDLQRLGEQMIVLADVEADWQQPGFSLTDSTVGLFRADELVGVAEVHGARAEVFVDPRAQGRGLGSALMRWTWAVTAAAGQAKVGQSVPAADTEAIALFERSGYALVYTSWVLELEPDREIPFRDLPPGLTIRPFRQDLEERAVHRLIEDAFNWPDRAPRTFEDWRSTSVLRTDFDPAGLLVLVEEAAGGDAPTATADADAGSIVGVCWWLAGDDEVWVNSVAVRADRRLEGLGRALLARAFADGRARGLHRARLNTDSRTGALGLYQHLGMAVTLTFEHWSRPLP